MASTPPGAANPKPLLEILPLLLVVLACQIVSHQIKNINCCISLIAAAIPLRWWQMMTLSKSDNPLHQLIWLAADRADDKNTFKIDAPPALSNLHQDSVAPARLQRRLMRQPQDAHNGRTLRSVAVFVFLKRGLVLMTYIYATRFYQLALCTCIVPKLAIIWAA